jgi:SOS response associated peptidase (SRAP)
MCGRYRLSRRKQIVEEHFDIVSGEEDWSPRYNVAPTQPVPIIRQHPERRQVPAHCNQTFAYVDAPSHFLTNRFEIAFDYGVILLSCSALCFNRFAMISTSYFLGA